MASRSGIEIGPVMVLVTMFWARAAAAQQFGCASVLITLAPCLNYITRSSSTPSSPCCSELANVVQSKPQCLCAALNGGGASLGIAINQTLALALPGACNVQTPRVSQCNADASGPTTSPVASPVGSPVVTPGESSIEIHVSPTSSSVAGAGSKTVPSTGKAASYGSNVKMPLWPIIGFVFVASYGSIFSSF